MKKTLKVLLAVVITPIALFLILTLLLYCPPVQKWAVEKAAQVASEKTGMRITVEQLRLSFPLDLRLQGLKALQPNDSLPGKTDTIADVRSLTTHVQMLPLLSGRVEVDWLTFKGLRMNTDQLIGDLRIKADLERLHLVSHGVSLGEERAKVNLADIRGGYIDVALGDTMPKDTAKKEVLWKIDVDRLQLAHTDFRLHLPGDTMSVKAHFGEATARRAVLQLKDNTYKVGALDWHDGALAYDQNFVPPRQKGFRRRPYQPQRPAPRHRLVLQAGVIRNLSMGRCSHHCYIVTLLHVTLRISHPPHAVRPPREAVGHPPRQLPYSASPE